MCEAGAGEVLKTCDYKNNNKINFKLFICFSVLMYEYNGTV